MKNLEKVVDRIQKAVQNKEKIILYGDADLDGVGSVIILEEAIETLGGKVDKVYFPDREREGYGLNPTALDFLKKFSPALLITLDCGIGNFKEIDSAREMGFEVIVVDHHQILGKLPAASLIVDPYQPGDEYPFKQLACVGISYKLVKSLLLRAKQWKHPEKFLELTALGTLADQMPQVEDNQKLIQEGILALDYTQRPGLKALIELTGFSKREEIYQKIISPLNSAGPEDHSNQIYSLLKEKDFQKAKETVKILIQNVDKKKKEIGRIYQESEERIGFSLDSLIFEGDSSWHLILLGPVASKLCQKYQRPVFLYRMEKDFSQGAVRVPSGINSVQLMQKCSQLLESYGGHPPASGFRIKSQNLEEFKKCLIENLNQ